MYKIWLKDITNKYEYDELIKIFLKPQEYSLFSREEEEAYREAEGEALEFSGTEKNAVKQSIYRCLQPITGKTPEWGIHTGVRPVKLVGELIKTLGSPEAAEKKLRDFYLFSREKTDLVMKIHELQQQVLQQSETSQAGVYIGIPFCPTRCLYCSFTSNQVSDAEIERYLEALLKEIQYTGRRMKERGIYPESVYIGGGTPTTLNPQQLLRLLSTVYSAFDMSRLREFTCEAGRPDTITVEKLKIMYENGVGRISINPQTMKDETLKLIGRSHSSADVYGAFEMADKVGIPIINADIIAGLPEESPEDFRNTIDTLLKFDPENITVHTLAVKRASRLIEQDSDYHYRQAAVVKEMLGASKEILRKAGYAPYYLYRQKHMAGALENVGFSKKGCESIYNIRIMDEHQTIIAMGAGGISKVYYPEENRLERVPNVSNYDIYISRLDEMMQRKEENIFRR